MTIFTTGDRELDMLIGEIPPRYMLLIVGHPGAGKTTLASSICYANTLKGYRCLYISFYEDKDKIFNNMAKLGIDLATAEARNLLTYIKMPVISPREVIEVIKELIAKDGYSIVVLDSINPIMELYRKKEQRAILLNFFYNLVSTINGLLVAIAEIPWGKESLNLGAIEFVADAIVYLKHRVFNGLLVRILEVRKTRGSPLNVVEIPFDIAEGKGIVVYIPRNPEKPMVVSDEKLKSRGFVEEVLGPVYRGDVVTISFPPNIRPPLTIVPIISLIIENELKTLVVSYRYSPTEIINILKATLVRYVGLEPIRADQIINKYIHIESVNPAAISIPRLVNLELRLIEKVKPDLVAFHSCEIPWRLVKLSNEDTYWSQLINQLIWLENQGIIVVRFLSRVDKHFVKMSEALSDLVIRVYYSGLAGGSLRQVWHVWRRGDEPKAIDLSSREVVEKMSEYLKMFKDIVEEKFASSAQL